MLYAAVWQAVFAVVEITGPPENDPSRTRWSWRFPIRPLATVAGRPMLASLKLLLDRARLFTDAEERQLPALLKPRRTNSQGSCRRSRAS